MQSSTPNRHKHSHHRIRTDPRIIPFCPLPFQRVGSISMPNGWDVRVWLSYILADLLVSLSCTPCLALSYLIHPRELRDVTIILPCNQYKILDALLLGLVLEGGVCIPYDCLLMGCGIV